MKKFPEDIINRIENTNLSIDEAIDEGYIGAEYTNLPQTLYH